jgi:hypothetical protein
MRNMWIGDCASPDIFKEAGTGPSRRRTVTATVHGVARLASYRATLFLCAYRIAAIPNRRCSHDLDDAGEGERASLVSEPR